MMKRYVKMIRCPVCGGLVKSLDYWEKNLKSESLRWQHVAASVREHGAIFSVRFSTAELDVLSDEAEERGISVIKLIHDEALQRLAPL